MPTKKTPKKPTTKKAENPKSESAGDSSSPTPPPAKLSAGIHSVSYEVYAKAYGVRKSDLDIIAELTPAHLKARMDSTEDDSTPAQRIGIIVHRALLEPDTFKNGFHVRPKGLQFTTVEGKAWKIGHQDRPIISFDEATMIEKMVSSVHTHPFAKKLLLNAETERSIFVEDENGIMRKMRLDALTAGTTMPDIKTCENASDKWIERQISQFRYHVQAAFYLDNMKLIGIEKRQWFFVCCEKSPPYAVRCLQLIGDVIDYGKMLYQRDLQVYRTCLETGTWPAWSNGFDQIGLPSYEMRALEQMG